MQKQSLLESLEKEGFSSEIIKAFNKVPRENFIPKNLEELTGLELDELAYLNRPLPISDQATISQPYTIAKMIEFLDVQKGQKILEVGSGCGYVLALLSEMVGDKGKVYGIEVVKELVDKSKQNLKDYNNTHVEYGNGRTGIIEYSPYDRILISAACEKFPEHLFNQLKPNGIIVAPINDKSNEKDTQELVALEVSPDKLIIKNKISGFIFVPFIEN